MQHDLPVCSYITQTYTYNMHMASISMCNCHIGQTNTFNFTTCTSAKINVVSSQIKHFLLTSMSSHCFQCIPHSSKRGYSYYLWRSRNPMIPVVCVFRIIYIRELILEKTDCSDKKQVGNLYYNMWSFISYNFYIRTSFLSDLWLIFQHVFPTFYIEKFKCYIWCVYCILYIVP